MFASKPRDSPSSFYHNISLPKQSTQVKSTSTRCISVSKNEVRKYQQTNLNSKVVAVAPPKQLTVRVSLHSTTWARATTRDWLGEY